MGAHKMLFKKFAIFRKQVQTLLKITTRRLNFVGIFQPGASIIVRCSKRWNFYKHTAHCSILTVENKLLNNIDIDGVPFKCGLFIESFQKA